MVGWHRVPQLVAVLRLPTLCQSPSGLRCLRLRLRWVLVLRVRLLRLVVVVVQVVELNTGTPPRVPVGRQVPSLQWPRLGQALNNRLAALGP